MGGLIGQVVEQKCNLPFALGLEEGRGGGGVCGKPAERIEQHHGLTADDLGKRRKCFVQPGPQLKE